MPSANTITLVDDLAANVTFNPHRISAQSQLFNNTDDATIDEGADTLEYSMSPSSKQRDSRHVNLKLVTPIEQTIDGIVSIASKPMTTVKSVIPPGMTLAEKQRHCALVGSAVADALFKGYVEDNEVAW